MSASKKPKPTELITYLCTRCRWDFARTEDDKPSCTLCGQKDRLQELKREAISPQAMEAAMMRSMERLMGGLEKAYASGTEEGMNDKEEIMLLETMVKAKNLEKQVKKAFGRKTKRKARAA